MHALQKTYKAITTNSPADVMHKRALLSLVASQYTTKELKALFGASIWQSKKNRVHAKVPTHSLTIVSYSMYPFVHHLYILYYTYLYMHLPKQQYICYIYYCKHYREDYIHVCTKYHSLTLSVHTIRCGPRLPLGENQVIWSYSYEKFQVGWTSTYAANWADFSMHILDGLLPAIPWAGLVGQHGSVKVHNLCATVPQPPQ